MQNEIIMGNLRIIVFPYYKSLDVEIEESLCNKVFEALKKYRSRSGYENINTPDIGFRGLELTCGNSNSVYFYEKDIIYRHLNISSLLYDKNKSLFEKFAVLALKSHYNELRYFFQVIQNGRHKNHKRNLTDLQ